MSSVAECMCRRPVQVEPTTRLKEAVEKMARHGLRHVAVVEPDGTFIGIISYHDVRTALTDGSDGVEDRGVLSVTKLGTPTLTVDATTEEAWALLSRAPGLNPLPVLQNGKLAGTVSQHDLLRALAGLPPLERHLSEIDPLDQLDTAPTSPWPLPGQHSWMRRSADA